MTLLIRDDFLHGIINYKDSIFKISNLNQNTYVVYETPLDTLPREAEEHFAHDIPCPDAGDDISGNNGDLFCEDIPLPGGGDSGGSSGEANIRVLTVYTQDALTDMGSDANAIARLALMANQTNDGFANNEIDDEVSIDHVATQFIDYNEAASHSAILDDLSDNQELANMRDYYGADVVGILVANDDWCGQADRVNATSATAFFTVNVGCTNFTFPHELGHLLGARHNDDGNGTFNRGYRDTSFLNDDDDFRTVMARGDERRINFFSTPAQTEPLTGASIGVTNHNDNERQVLSRASAVAAFKSKTTQSIDTPSVTAWVTGCYGENLISWTEEWSEGNVIYNLYRSNYSNMSGRTLVQSNGSTSRYMSLTTSNDRPYFAVEACDDDGCSDLSGSARAHYLNNCR